MISDCVASYINPTDKSNRLFRHRMSRVVAIYMDYLLSSFTVRDIEGWEFDIVIKMLQCPPQPVALWPVTSTFRYRPHMQFMLDTNAGISIFQCLISNAVANVISQMTLGGRFQYSDTKFNEMLLKLNQG